MSTGTPFANLCATTIIHPCQAPDLKVIEGASVSANTGINTLKETDEVLSLTPDVAHTLLVSHADEGTHVTPLFCPHAAGLQPLLLVAGHAYQELLMLRTYIDQ